MTVLLARWKPGPRTTATAVCMPSTVGWRRNRTSEPDGQDAPAGGTGAAGPGPRPGAVAHLVRCLRWQGLDAWRDAALLMLLLDAGSRRSELLGMRLDDIDPRVRAVIVRGKGGRQRALPYGNKTAMALDRYLRARSRQRLAHLDALWLGRRRVCP